MDDNNINIAVGAFLEDLEVFLDVLNPLKSGPVEEWSMIDINCAVGVADALDMILSRGWISKEYFSNCLHLLGHFERLEELVSDSFRAHLYRHLFQPGINNEHVATFWLGLSSELRAQFPQPLVEIPMTLTKHREKKYHYFVRCSNSWSITNQRRRRCSCRRIRAHSRRCSTTERRF